MVLPLGVVDMSNTFHFEGDFRRKPNQTLGGSSRGAEHKDAVLHRAEAQRRLREKERRDQAAAFKIQGFFRSTMARQVIRRRYAIDFDDQMKIANFLSDAELFQQMYRMNILFRGIDEDVHRLLELGKVLLSKYPVVTKAMKTDPSVRFAVRSLIIKCFRCLSRPNVLPAVLLRLIEVYTDSNNYFEGGEYNPLYHQEILRTIANVWLTLVLEGSLFTTYRRFLENKIPAMNSETDANRIIESYDYLMIYKRVLSMPTELKDHNVVGCVRNVQYNAEAVTNLILSSFAKSFSENVIPVDGNSGVAAFFILPRLCKFVQWENWVKVLSIPTLETTQPNSMRHLFYTTLVFLRNAELNEGNMGMFVDALNKLRMSIDPSFGPTTIHQGLRRTIQVADDEADEMDVEEEIEEVPLENKYSRQCVNIYLQECQLVYSLLKIVLNRPEVATWLGNFQLKKWRQSSELISCIVKLEPRMSSLDFKFLSAMSYRRDFMRALCNHIIQSDSEKRTEDDFLAFCWFFNHLCATLHDAEFLVGLPIVKDDLTKLVIILRDLFCDRIVRDNDLWSGNSVLAAATDLLSRIHDRNDRLHMFSEEIFTSPYLAKICPVESHNLKFEHLTSNDNEPPAELSPLEEKLLKALKEFPYVLSFRDRVRVWNRILDHDRSLTSDPFHSGRGEIQIRRNYIYEDAFEKLSPENVPNLRRTIRISLVNVVGVMEAGIDGGGLLREFLTEATKAAMDANRGLFRFDSQNRIYPNPIAKKLMRDFRKHFFSVGRLVGKALYEQTLLELPLAAFFIQYCIQGTVPSAVDFLATLDPALHKNLLTLKTFNGDVTSLGLDFTVTVDELGETRVVELKRNGKEIWVDNNNVIEYIHLVADYKINREMEEECRSFRAGMLDVVPHLKMFSWKELQTLISGSDKPIDVDDWRANTNYGQEFSDAHPAIQMFWTVVKGFDEKSLRMLLKFVTSCSRPPLLGFKDLVPKFGIQSAGKTDRLPTASTCMNLLKLPELTDPEVLREKLIYAISAQCGFELS